MIYLVIALSLFGVVWGARGASSRFQGWALPFIVAGLVFAFMSGGWALFVGTALADAILFSIIAKKSNDKHRASIYANADEMIAGIVKKQSSAKHKR